MLEKNHQLFYKQICFANAANAARDRLIPTAFERGKVNVSSKWEWESCLANVSLKR